MIPNQQTIKYKVADWLHRNPSSSIEAVINCLPGRKKCYLRVCVSELISDGLLIESNGLLTCGREFQEHFDHLEVEIAQAPKVEIVPPRVVNVFTPEMKNYRLPVMGTRPEEMEIMQARSKHL